MNSKTDFKSMKVEAWPAVDRRLWIEARSEADDPDEDGGPASHWRPATVALVERGWGTFLDWSERTGRLIPDERPDERIARPVVRAFVTAYAEGHAGKTVVNAVRALIDFVRVTCPDTDLTHLDRVLRRWKRRAAPTKLPAERMRPASELLAIGAELIERGLATIGTNRVRGALAYRNGLIFLMELALPLRLSNVADLRIGETFRKEGNQWRAVQPGASMKNGLEHDGLYPAFLTPVIDHWVEVIRPLLRGEGKGVDEGMLWLGYDGASLRSEGFAKAVTETNRDMSGIPVSTHGFRRTAATQAAISDPKHAVGITAALLAHASPNSAAIYDLAGSFEAQRFWLKTLDRLRARDREE